MTLEGSGTQSATVGTEHTLDTVTAVGTFVLVVDTNALADGATPDEVELRAYGKCLTGGTERLAYTATYVGQQGAPLKFSVPIPSDIECRFTLKQTTGTGRSFPWKVLQL